MYKIEEVEGIGTSYADKLMSVGIKTTEDLLNRCDKPKGRQQVAEETGISPKLILKWTNHADLMRLRGIGGQFAELLEAAGVDTVKELRHRIPGNLHTRLVEVNDKKNLCNRVPSEKELTTLVEEAKATEPRVTY